MTQKTQIFLNNGLNGLNRFWLRVDSDITLIVYPI